MTFNYLMIFHSICEDHAEFLLPNKLHKDTEKQFKFICKISNKNCIYFVQYDILNFEIVVLSLNNRRQTHVLQ